MDKDVKKAYMKEYFKTYKDEYKERRNALNRERMKNDKIYANH